MSRKKNRDLALRWMVTAEEDLDAAETLVRTRHYAQACFFTQQAGEKAVKALWYLVDSDTWGHSVQKLVTEYPHDLPDRALWVKWGATLDKFYIPTRYPNGLPDLTPGQVYQPEDAEEGLKTARNLIEGCRKYLESFGG